MLTYMQGSRQKYICRLPGYQQITRKKFKSFYTTISLWSPTNSGAKVSVLVKWFRICNIFCTLCFGWALTEPFVKKSQKKLVFSFSPFWNLTFEMSKAVFLKNFSSFRDMTWQNVSFVSMVNHFITYLWAPFHGKFVHTDWSFIQVTKLGLPVNNRPSQLCKKKYKIKK